MTSREVLGQARLFGGLEEEELAALASMLQPARFSPGAVLPLEGLVLVLQGSVCLSTPDEVGEPIVFDRVEPGEMFGELSLVTTEVPPYVAQAEEEVELEVLPRRAFTQYLLHHPDSALEIIDVIAHRLMRLESVLQKGVSRNVAEVHAERLTFGQRCADRFAAVVGSWPFLITQTILLAGWIALNLVAWFRHWDPYPFILLNLTLSFQAAYAGPIILMSQNRAAARDRLEAKIDYEVNRKAEAEVGLILRRLDALERR